MSKKKKETAELSDEELQQMDEAILEMVETIPLDEPIVRVAMDLILSMDQNSSDREKLLLMSATFVGALRMINELRSNLNTPTTEEESA